MSEVQNHGVLFEDMIIQNITGISKAEFQKTLINSYTASMDIPAGQYSDVNYSIKVSKQGISIGCGDILRFRKHCAEDAFTITVGVWHQIDSETKRYTQVLEFYVKPEHYHTLFADIQDSDLRPFVDYVKAIPAGKTAQMANRVKWKAHRQDIYNKCGQGLVKIDAKIDSKDQRRVQCSLKINDLKNSGIPYKIHTDNYQGIELPYDVQSKPRSFA